MTAKAFPKCLDLGTIGMSVSVIGNCFWYKQSQTGLDIFLNFTAELGTVGLKLCLNYFACL